ncbi:MAG: 30S ribosomal protein S5 [candidate division WS6 bacterium OLB20]|uniref:Small ribosomal subunit protein uS5 n=1 Tax=candidate division WS6 bacterium OLB20 TaxID=1617426 RepID=A0A136LX68_9BACT|nr:MAG: 30S ribosomal protein S5 [candidate division WS6 bacterium OLB20]
MAETKAKAKAKTDEKQTPDTQAQDSRSRQQGRRGGRQDKRGGRGGRGKRENNDGVDKRIVSIRRVARTYAGGKRMRLSVLVVAGDKNGRVGAGLAKGVDVRTAEQKALNLAKKNMKKVNLRGGTIPHELTYKKGAARVFMKPAAPGTGVIAGGAMRAVLELAGVKDILTKVIGTQNSISNVYAAIEALESLKPVAKQTK